MHRSPPHPSHLAPLLLLRPRRTTTAQRTWQAELDGLAGCPRERWPLAVRRLVEDVEARATAEYALRLGEETDALEAQYTGELEVRPCLPA